MHQAVTLLGCFDEGLSYWLCGIDIERKGPDWHETKFAGNVLYPRTLVPAMPDIDGDGRTTPETTCSDPLDCKNKCEFLKRTARQGTGTPSACQMCDSPCPLNFLTTIVDLKDAIYSDVMQAIRLAAVCLGAGGFQKCICSVFGMMEPHWRKVSRNPKIRCEEGDPLAQIMDAILQQVTLLAEDLINQVIGIIDGILQSIGGWIGIPRLPRVCFPIDSQPQRCDGGGLTTAERNALAACYDDSQGMQNLVRTMPILTCLL